MGLAYLVFPAADYSRFSHSIGVCHVTGLILENLRENGVEDLPVEEIQQYRLAGLLHDVGHYPFSHAMEDAIQNHYSGALVRGGEPTEFYNHEAVSKHILIENPNLREVFHSGGYVPKPCTGSLTGRSRRGLPTW